MTEEERKKAEEEEKAKQQNALKSFLPYSDGFGFGDFIQLLFVAIAGYFVARIDGVQDFFGKFIDGDKPGSGKEKIKSAVDGIAETVLGWFPDGFLDKIGINPDITKNILEATDEQIAAAVKDMSPQMQDVIKKNYTVFAPLAVEANGGSVKLSQKNTVFTNDKTLFALITKNPDLARKLVAATMGDNTAPTEETAAIKKTMLESIKAMASDDRLNVLLNPTNLKATCDMMVQMGYSQGLDSDKLQKTLTPYIQNGVPSPVLRTRLLSMLDAELARIPAKGESTPTPAPAAEPATAESIQFDAALTKAGLIKKLGDTKGPAVDTLNLTLGDEKFLKLATVLTAEEAQINDAQKRIFILNLPEKDKAALRTFFNDASVNFSQLDKKEQEQMQELKNVLNSSPQMQKALGTLAANGIDPVNLKKYFTPKDNTPAQSEFLLTQLMGSDFQTLPKEVINSIPQVLPADTDKTLKSMATPYNLDVISRFATAINNIKMPANKHLATSDAAIVTAALLEFANGNGQPMKDNAKLISQLFAGNQFASAFKTMLKELDLPGKKDVKTALLNEWGTREDGMLEILSSESSVKRLPDIKSASDLTLGEQLYYATNGFTGSATKISENLEHLKNISAAVNVKTGTPVTPSVTDTKSSVYTPQVL